MTRSLASILLALAAMLCMTPPTWAQLEEDAYSSLESRPWARRDAADSVATRQSSQRYSQDSAELSGCGWSCYPPDYSCYPSGYAYRGNTQVLVVLRDPEAERVSAARVPASYGDFHDCQYDVYVTGNAQSVRPNTVSAERYPCLDGNDSDRIRAASNLEIWSSVRFAIKGAAAVAQSQLGAVRAASVDYVDAILGIAIQAADGLAELVQRELSERTLASVQQLEIQPLEDTLVVYASAPQGLVSNAVSLYFRAVVQAQDWKQSCDLYIDNAILLMGQNIACVDYCEDANALLTVDGQSAELDWLVEQALRPQHWSDFESEVPVASLEGLADIAPIPSISRALRNALSKTLDGSIEISQRPGQRTE